MPSVGKIEFVEKELQIFCDSDKQATETRKEKGTK